MHRRNFARLSGIIVDECLHGAFLDAGELKRIVKFLKAGGESIGRQTYQTEQAQAQAARDNRQYLDTDDLQIAQIAVAIVDGMLS